MGHKNYSKFSQKFTKTENKPMEGQVTFDEITNNTNNEETVEINTLVSNDFIAANETDNYEVIMIGVVKGCGKLNVRKEANKDSEPLCIINESEEVKVDLNDSSSEDFYRVCTASGIEGYCMKEYINIK